ncbi:Sec7 domain, alpha orthogonal bundle [Phytophthora cactorum]|nr:Sec7 domain, alpha orthogonal bundle [Phytophthora cactorum]
MFASQPDSPAEHKRQASHTQPAAIEACDGDFVVQELEKGSRILGGHEFHKDTPRSITSFLRIYHDFFDETEIGDYLGEGDEDIKVQVRRKRSSAWLKHSRSVIGTTHYRILVCRYCKIIAYSIIMLNTDLHNPQKIYDDIAHNPMHIKGSRVIPKATREASVSGADLENEKFRGESPRL